MPEMLRFEYALERLSRLHKSGLFSKPFYENRFSNDHKNPFDSYDTFKKIPFMTKSQVRESSVCDRTNTLPRDIYGVFSSSGTTGNKTFYIYNRNDKNIHERFVRCYLGELGVGEEDLGGIMVPIDTDVMAHTMIWEFVIMGAGYINCPEPTPEAMLNAINNIPISVIATRPDVVSAPLYDLDRRALFERSPVRKLLLGGSFLTNERRQVLERLWGADCYALFGMSELFGPMASECCMKDGLHYLESDLMVEIIDPSTSDPVEEGGLGVAVYTTLWEKGFPLLRYWTDDVFTIDRSACDCHLDLPKLRYHGRIADCCAVLDDGVFRYSPANHKLTDLVFSPDIETCLFANGMYGEYECRIANGRAVVYSEECDYGSMDVDGAQGSLERVFKGKVTLFVTKAGTLKRGQVKTKIIHEAQ